MGLILVVGSANLDTFVLVDEHPGPGRTVVGRETWQACGGKGANQAVAAARLGCRVALVAALGGDDAGRMIRRALRDSGVDDRFVHDTDQPTGAAVVAVTPDGGNGILVIPGANAVLRPENVLAARRLRGVTTVVVQMEVADPAVAAAIALARTTGARLIVNLAPARPLPEALLAPADPLVLNEHEAADLTGRSPDEPVGLAMAAGRLARSAVVTLGGNGAMYARRGQEPVHVPAPAVGVVDTTGAGDAFTGALAVALDRGDPPGDALRFATRVAAFSVGRRGAQPSYPTSEELHASTPPSGALPGGVC